MDAPQEKVSGEAFNVGSNDQNYQIYRIAQMVRDVVPHTDLEVVPDDPDKRSYNVSFDKIERVLGFRAEKTPYEGIVEVKQALEQGRVDDIDPHQDGPLLPVPAGRGEAAPGSLLQRKGLLMARVEFYRHALTEDDIAAAADALRSVFLTTGPRAALFEEAFATYLGVGHAAAVSSCTSALFLCLKALNIGPGDEVITTPMTFIATANAILHAGATPVFVDVEPDTGNIDARQVERAITSRTRAVIPGAPVRPDGRRAGPQRHLSAPRA